jgi:hypothetical protein
MFPGFLTARRARKAEATEPMTLWDWRFTPFGILSAPPPAGNTPARIMLQPLHRPVPPVKPIPPVNGPGLCDGLAQTAIPKPLPADVAGNRAPPPAGVFPQNPALHVNRNFSRTKMGWGGNDPHQGPRTNDSGYATRRSLRASLHGAR